MKTIRQDDRTPEQRETHRYAVVARDNFMSGWGRASSGFSRCAWAIDNRTDAEDKLYDWVKNRKEMRHVRVVFLPKYQVPRNTAHFHIYVADNTHPAFA